MQGFGGFSRSNGRLGGGRARVGQRRAAPLVAFLLLLVTGSAQAGKFPIGNASITVTVSCPDSGSSPGTQPSVESIANAGSFNYLTAPAPLLSFSVDPAAYYSDGLAESSVSCVQSGETLTITANASNSPLAFSITLAPDGANPAVIVSSQVTYQGPATNPATLFFRALLPNVQNFQLPNTPTLPGTTAMAMVPQTIGTLLPLSQVTASLGASYGSLAADPTIGLPTSLNVMEIAEVYDGSAASGGGLFFIDLDGDYGNNIPPLQFNVTNTGSGYQIAGSWTVLLKLNQTVTLPRLAIGVHASGDWSNAVNYYVSKRSPAWTYPDTPEWFREAGGIYSLGVAGGGSFLGASNQPGAFPAALLTDTNFGIQWFACKTKTSDGTKIGMPTASKPNPPGQRCLLDVYYDAQSLGSYVVYLTSWWDHPSNCKSSDTMCLSDYYANKGDWSVRADLGGAAALNTGVGQIHAAGGKVILYMEAYIAAETSNLVQSGPGNSWQAQPAPPIPASDSTCMYANNDCMAIANTQWQDYLINRAVSAMKTTGVDGFFLNSWGFQMNWPVGTSSEDVNYTSQQWTAAALRFVDRFRAAIQAVNPKAEVIVMGENNSGQLLFHWDGGSASDLAWGGAYTQSNGRLWASPIRYAMPNPNFFVNGNSLDSVNQVIASGHNLALGPFWLLDVPTYSGTKPFPANGKYPTGTPVPKRNTNVSGYISALMAIRNSTYVDALVYGTQLPMPTTNPGAPDVVAFMYYGNNSQIMAIVNNSPTAQSISVAWNPKFGTGAWSAVMPSDLVVGTAPAATITVTVSPAPSASNTTMGGLVILARRCAPFYRPLKNPWPVCTPPQFYGITQEVPLMNESFANGAGNWTNWTSGGLWSTSTDILTMTSSLQVHSLGDSSLLFYDFFRRR